MVSIREGVLPFPVHSSFTIHPSTSIDPSFRPREREKRDHAGSTRSHPIDPRVESFFATQRMCLSQYTITLHITQDNTPTPSILGGVSYTTQAHTSLSTHTWVVPFQPCTYRCLTIHIQYAVHPTAIHPFNQAGANQQQHQHTTHHQTDIIDQTTL